MYIVVFTSFPWLSGRSRIVFSSKAEQIAYLLYLQEDQLKIFDL